MISRILLLVVGAACLIGLLWLSGATGMGRHTFAAQQRQATATPTSVRPTVGPIIPNPAIDMEGYLAIADEAAAHREQRRVSEAEFIRLSREPGTIILDARSAEKFAELHVKGAINLSFPDIAIKSLQETLPDTNARILIYCNNNFENAEIPFPSKAYNASLNISTYISLYSYGYRNVYELGPLIDINASILEFETGR